MHKHIIDNFSIKNTFSPRPATAKELWVLFLLPVALIVTAIKHTIVLTTTYKLSIIVAVVLMCHSLYLFRKCSKNEALTIVNVYSFALALSSGCLFHFWLNRGWIFSLFSGLFSTFSFLSFYTFLLVAFKESFSLSEAGLISQGATLFFYNAGHNIFTIANANFALSNMQIATIIIQVGLLGILTLAYIVYKLNIKTAIAFYTIACLTLTLTIIFPLHIILKQSPLLWIFSQVFYDVTLVSFQCMKQSSPMSIFKLFQLKLFIYWSACIVFAILAVNNQIRSAQKASTSTRKIFHILAVLVYVPGLYLRCSFLYMATGIVLGGFFALELLRLFSIPPVGKQLQIGYEMFKDDKDAGLLALTPIYLLVGVSMPIWLHPSPCDVTDSAQFTALPLVSGLLSIGIGDTAASYIGSSYGRFKWANSSKTIEGTLACIFSQLGCSLFLHYIGFLTYLSTQEIIRVILAIVTVSIVEAKTTQIDNLVLPLIMYIILI